MKRIVSSIAVLLFVPSGMAFAQQSAQTGTVAGDRVAVANIVMNAVTEVKLCGLALEKSHNADVKTLCQKTSRDNARTALAGAQLEQSLGDTDAILQPLPDTSATLDSLAQYSGRDFDREFLLGEIETEESQEHALRYGAEFTIDRSVKRYETAVLPRIARHLELAESALQGVAESAP